jgi:hypothetical protein
VKPTDAWMDLELPLPLATFVRACEVHCVAGCCGLDAYDVDARHMMAVTGELQAVGIISALDQLEFLLAQLHRHGGRVRSADPDLNSSWRTAAEAADYLGRWQHELLRLLVTIEGPTFFDRSWLVPLGAAVRGLAERFKSEADGGVLAILADALEEAGCQNAVLLEHCRTHPGDFPSCWAVNLLLGEWTPVHVNIGADTRSPADSS